MTTQGLLLQVNAALNGDRSKLVVQIEARNTLAHEVYWLNRFWRALPGGKREWDPRGPYRFELAGALRLLYGAAPVPPNTMVNNRFIPHGTRIDPGATAQVQEEIALPTQEFTIFEPPGPGTEYEPVEATNLAVIAHYVSPGERVKVEPSYIEPKYWFVRAPDQVVAVAYAVQKTDKIPVLRRKDPITRALLPGESPG